MFDKADIPRMFANLFQIGTVTEVEGAFVRVEFGDKDDEGENNSALLPVIASRAGDDRTWHALSVGEQVLFVSRNGDPSQGVVMGSINKDAAPPPSSDPDLHIVEYKDGSRFSYNKKTHELKATLCEGGRFEVNAPAGNKLIGNTQIEGTLSVTKTIDAQDNITSAKDVSDEKGTIQEMRDTYDGHDGHTTGDGKPSQKMN